MAVEADVVEGAANHGDEVVGGLGEDIGTGEDAGAFQLEAGLGVDDDVEGVIGGWGGLVDIVVTLGSIEGVGGDKERGIAATSDASCKKRQRASAVVVGAASYLLTVTC